MQGAEFKMFSVVLLRCFMVWSDDFGVLVRMMILYLHKHYKLAALESLTWLSSRPLRV